MENHNICSICLDTVSNSEEYKLECNHIYHTHCIIDWFRKSTGNCPLCNHNPNILTNDSFYNGYSTKKLINERYQLIKRKKYNKKNTSLELKKNVDRVIQLENNKKQFIKDRQTFVKDPEVKKIKKLIQMYNTKGWKMDDRINKQKYKVITMFPGFMVT